MPFQNCRIALIVLLMMLFGSWYYIFLLRKRTVQRERQLQNLEEIASIDSLTLIYNRHMLDIMLKKQVSISERYRQFFSIIFFDIDDFKLINDRYGHDVGDEVLVGLSGLVANSMRESDIFGRWGGDEFLILLPESTQKQAARLVELIEERMSQYAFPKGKKVTCTFGVAAYQFGDNAKEILKRADEELYLAKSKKKILKAPKRLL